MLFKMILREECNVGARLLGWCSRDRCTPWENTNQEPPTDFTDAHRLGGYGIPAIPTQPLNYLPTEVSGGEEPPTEFTEFTEFSGARYSPTDFTDIHRLGGYGILPYPRCHQTIFPQKPQNLTQPNHLWTSVKSVGGSSPPEASVNSVDSVGEPYAA